MDNMDESESNAKISDSAYSNSCSNSQSRRGHSSKSTNSGSHSSGSSGYGGKPSTSESSNTFSQPTKEDKDPKKKIQSQTEKKIEEEAVVDESCVPPEPVPEIAITEETKNVDEQSSKDPQPEDASNMDVSSSGQDDAKDEDGFSCVISMYNGVVIYTTASLTPTLGFAKDMWIGRSFIDFVHPKDRNTFASQITNGLAIPQVVNEKQKAQNTVAESTMVCRIRRYRCLTSGFAVKERTVTFMPFMLKLSLKNIEEDIKVPYLVIMATPFYSAFKVPSEKLTSPTPFVMRHSARGILEYIDPASVPYLGYLPQDVKNMNALLLYHDDDLPHLRDIYEKIAREGSVPRSLQYRMKTQNGDFLKLETEWSSFINPWSMKLEFVIGKHIIIEGPANPDVFQSPDPKRTHRVSEEDRNKAVGLRESIVKMMNEVLTKPAELAKQCLSKRCQDLASIMENLIADQPKTDEDLRPELNDKDHSLYTDKSGLEERDSVMLGGISPHHEYNDSKSSTETPLSYNQLNYNENLQRYFANHQPDSLEIYSTYHIFGANKIDRKAGGQTFSPVGAQDSGDSIDMSSCESSRSGKLDGAAYSGNCVANIGDYNPIRLTESLLIKHNNEMEKELAKMRRVTRTKSKGDREKATNVSRQKTKEHLARCNASFQPTLTPANTEFLSPQNQSNGLKRKPYDAESNKQCSARKTRRRQTPSPPHDNSNTSTQHQHDHMNKTAPRAHWSNPAGTMNNYIVGVGVTSSVPVMNSVSGVHGVIPMYYSPAMTQSPITTSSPHNPTIRNTQRFQTPMPCMMYGQPFLYSPINAQMTYATPHSSGMRDPCTHRHSELNPLNLASKNYEQSSEAAPERYTLPGADPKAIRMNDDNPDRTDGESSYSSFYSSFFKTDSGSAEDSDQNRKSSKGYMPAYMSDGSKQKPDTVKKIQRRKMEPPWMEQVSLTSDLIYKYQVVPKSMEEVLETDKNKIAAVQQPSLVNEQLEQLYKDLQLEGKTARLSLEDETTSSSGSEEEDSAKKNKNKRDHSKLVMIYEEDAALPSPQSIADQELSQEIDVPSEKFFDRQSEVASGTIAS